LAWVLDGRAGVLRSAFGGRRIPGRGFDGIFDALM